MSKPKRQRVSTIATMRRRNIRNSAIGGASVAVARIEDARHRERGLHVCETGHAWHALVWLAAKPIISQPNELELVAS